MGDRCYLELRLRGRIETVEAFEEIAAVLGEGCWQADCNLDGSVAAETRDALRLAAEKGDDAGFYQHECNYANIDEEEAILQRLGVAYEVSHEEGGDYPAGAWSWSPTRGKVEVERVKGMGAAIAVTELEKAMATADPLAAVRALIDHGNAAEGADLPGFSLSDQVREHLGMPAAG